MSMYKMVIILFIMLVLIYRVSYSEQLDTVERVNTQTNKTLIYKTDIENYGVADLWILPTKGFSDCEDYALTKMYKLIELGVLREDLSLVEVKLSNGKGHVLLLYQNKYILDNRFNTLRHWIGVKYKWLKIQGPLNCWYTIKEVKGKLLPGRLTTSPLGWINFENNYLTKQILCL